MGINLEELKGICLDLFRFSGMGFSLWDENKRNIYSYPDRHCELCRLVRESEELALLCRECDTRGLNEAERTGETFVYRCHIGLTEAVVPVIQGTDTVAYLMMGQTVESEQIGVIRAAIERVNDAGLAEKMLQALPLTSTHPAEKIGNCVSLLGVLADYMSVSYVIRKSNESLCERVAEYVERHISGLIKASDIAAALSVSPSTLYKSVKAEMGISPTALIRNIKMREACRLLRESSLSVSAVASRIGMSDYNYFIKLFRREFGLSPLRYRRASRSSAIEPPVK